MKSDIVLVRPNLDLKEEALSYRREHFLHGENIIYRSELFDSKRTMVRLSPFRTTKGIRHRNVISASPCSERS